MSNDETPPPCSDRDYSPKEIELLVCTGSSIGVIWDRTNVLAFEDGVVSQLSVDLHDRRNRKWDALKSISETEKDLGW